MAFKRDSVSLAQIAQEIDAELIGDPNYSLDGLASLESATASQLSFLSDKKYKSALAETCAGAVIVAQFVESENLKNQLIVKNPYVAYAKVSALFATKPPASLAIHPTAVVSKHARLGIDVSVGANCVIEDDVVLEDGCEVLAGTFIGARSVVGAASLLYPNVTIYHDIKIGRSCIIHGGTVVGSDGFGFAPTDDGWLKIQQLGGVTIGNNVEIGSNTAIDRGALTDTIIEDGVIIDNQVHLAHNVKIGARTAIAGRCAIAGSTTIGARCTMGGCVAINGHIEIVDDVHLNGATVVTKSIKEPGVYSSGTLMQDVKQWRKTAVRVSQLEEWVARIKKLEEQLAD